MSQHADYCPRHLMFIFFDEFLKGIFIPILSSFDQFFFVQFLFPDKAADFDFCSDFDSILTLN